VEAGKDLSIQSYPLGPHKIFLVGKSIEFSEFQSKNTTTVICIGCWQIPLKRGVTLVTFGCHGGGGGGGQKWVCGQPSNYYFCLEPYLLEHP